MIAIHDVLDDRKSEIEFYYSVMVDIDNNTNDTLRTIDNQRFFRIMKSNFLLKLTVQDGKMTIHISLTSQNIVNLFPGTAEDAQKDGAELLQPTVDTVTYEDGISEEVNGFDVPVPALDEPFNLALIGTKGKWYDHEVIVSNPEKLE